LWVVNVRRQSLSVFRSDFLELLVIIGVVTVSAYSYGKKIQRSEDELKLTNLMLKHAQEIAEKQREISKLYAEYSAKTKQAQADLEETIAKLHAGEHRLRQKFTCPTVVNASASPSTRPDGAHAPGFSRKDAEIAFRIAGEGDTAIRKLALLQKYVNIITDLLNKLKYRCQIS
jgi:hypothetical protein